MSTEIQQKLWEFENHLNQVPVEEYVDLFDLVLSCITCLGLFFKEWIKKGDISQDISLQQTLPLENLFENELLKRSFEKLDVKHQKIQIFEFFKHLLIKHQTIQNITGLEIVIDIWSCFEI